MPDRGVQHHPDHRIATHPAGHECPVAGLSIKDIEVCEDCPCYQSVPERRQEFMD